MTKNYNQNNPQSIYLHREADQMECVNRLHFWVGECGCTKPTQSVRRSLNIEAGVGLTKERSEEQLLCGQGWPI